MRLFLLNRKAVFTPSIVAARAKIAGSLSRKELAVLARAGFIVRRKERQVGKKSLEGWGFNAAFEYSDALENLLFGTEFIDFSTFGKRFKNSGKIRLLLLGGIFNKSSNTRLDLLLVGDSLKKPVIDKIIRSLEAEIGKELSYAMFETPEFIYRASMYDKLIRDVIDFPHEKIINIGGLLQQVPQIITK